MKTKIIIAFVIVVLAILALFYGYQNSKDNEQVLPDDSSLISSDLDSSRNSNKEDNLKLLSQDVYSKTEALIKNGLPDTNPGISLNPIKGVYRNPF